MEKVFKLFIPLFLLAAVPLMALAVDQESERRNNGSSQSTPFQSDDPKLEVIISKAMADIFPEYTCWGERFDINISNVTGGIDPSCYGDPNIAINIAIFEDDGIWDDLVVEEWLVFPTGGLTAGIPFNHTYENLDLSTECDELDWVGEFYILVRGQCLTSELTFGEESVRLTFLPTAPVLTAPANGAIEKSLPVTLQWNSIYNASFYQVQFDDENTFTTPLVDEQTGNLNFETSGFDDSTYFWRVRAHNNTCGEGNWSPTWNFTIKLQTGVTEIQSPDLPKKFTLGQNYPNPFNPNTNIEFTLPRACHVKLDIYNIFGQKTKTLVDEKLNAGFKVVTWDGTNEEGIAVASGIYVYRLIAGDDQASKKMILLK